MKILAIHADFIEFQAKKKAFKAAEEGVNTEKQRVDECLVIFTAAEKPDESDPKAVLERYMQEIKNIATQVNATTLVLYPYAHLSSNLSNPKLAEQLMKDAQRILAEKYAVYRAPFGWYKSFNVSCKGHPLSELSRSFGPDQTGDSEVKDHNHVDLKREFKDEPFEYSSEPLQKESQINFAAAFIAAKAIKSLFAEAQIGSIGFYHDQAYVDVAGVKIRQDDFKRISKQMNKIVQADIAFEKQNDSSNLAPLQKEILTDIGQDKPSYQLEDESIVPLFQDPLPNSTKDVIASKLLNLGSAYWKGNEKNQQLNRIYLAGFVSEQKLQEYEKKQEEAENRSHMKIGKEQNLFVISELVGPGLPLLAPKGMIIRQQIVDFLWELHKDKDYKWVWTPHIAKDSLYKTSGHWDKFGDELFKVQGKTDTFVMKPMNCPHHMQIFDSFTLSYRDMPIRLFEPATIYRDEKSGQLHGLSRVRAITQDDGHLFCRVNQIKEEVGTIVSIVRQFYKILGMEDYWVSFSVRGEDKSKYLGTDEVWNTAEDALEAAAKENNLPYKRIEGEAAFYGPKLDFMFKDALGREWQLATIQCDFNLPERFDLSYMNEQSHKERPVVIHRAISGSLERFMSVLIEHFAGNFPVWLSPVQVKIVTVTDRSIDYATKIAKQLRAQDVRVEVDDRTETMGRKIRDGEKEKVPYILTIGDKEVEKQCLAVRDRKTKETTFDVNTDEFIAKVVQEIKERKL